MNKGLKKSVGSFVLASFAFASIFINFPVNVARADDIQDTTVSVSPSSGTLTVGQTLDVLIKQNWNMDMIELDPAGGACTINGKDVASSFQNLGNGDYKLSYTVASGDASVAAGQLAFSCAFKIGDEQHNVLSSFSAANTLTIDATGTTGGNDDDDTATTTDDTNTDDDDTATTTDDTNIDDDDSTQNGNINGDVTGGSTTQDNGTLAVTYIEQHRSVAVADGTIANGWKWVFHITVPSDETNVAMKFDNWTHTNGTNTISPANNMQISSAQSPGNTEAYITAANTYSASLPITGDLNPQMPGKQIQVSVEMGVPVGSLNGSYTTSYFVKSSAN